MTTKVSPEMNEASNRHWLYGFNVVVLVAVAVVILGFMLYLTAQHSWHKDMTSAGLYSLSGSTKNLLKQIDEKKQGYQLLSFFPASPSATQEEHRQQVMDQLEEYARWSANVKVEEAHGQTQDEVQTRIKALYAGELKPYEETIGEFDALAQELEKFLKEEGANVGAVAQKAGTPAAAVRQAAQLQGDFGTRAPESLAEARRVMRKAMEAALPQWSTVAGETKRTVDELATQLELFGDPSKGKDLFEPAIGAYFVSAAPRYKAMAEKLKAYQGRVGKLPALKVEGVLSALASNTVLVLGPGSAKVVGEGELFSAGPPAGGSEEPSSTFTGEQAISSALMSMIQPVKVKVVFVSAAAQQLTTGLYSTAAGVLRDSNFEVMEWAPPGPPTGPDQAPQEPNPPAEGKGVVWIVFPPAPPNQQMMMMGMAPPDARPVIEATRRHMGAGGQVMFLADASGGGFMGGGGYAYQDLVKDFGIDVQTKYTVVRQIERQDADSGEAVRRVMPVVQVEQYLAHEITNPLQSLPLIVMPVQGRAGYIGMPTVVAKRGTMPAEAEAAVLFTTPRSVDYWGESELKADATFDKTRDFGPPCPLAVAGVRFKGQTGKEQRVVVVGTSTLAANPMLEESQLMRVGNRLKAVAPFPGNSEFFRNSVLWLAGYENMIAVSTKASVAVRIGDISPGKLQAIRWGILFGGAPVAALLVGGIVLFLRRR